MDRRYRKTRALRLLRGEPTSLVPADQAVAHLARMLELQFGETHYAVVEEEPACSC